MLLHLARLTMRPELGVRGAALVSGASDAMSVCLGVAAPLALKAVVDQVQLASASRPLILTEVACLAIATLAPTALGGLKQVQITAVVERLAATLTLNATDAAFRKPEGVVATDLPAALARLPYSLQLIVDGLASRLAPTAVQLMASLVVLAAVAPRLEALLLTLTLVIYVVAVDVGHRAMRRNATSAYLQANILSHRLGDVLGHRLRILANDALTLERGGIEVRAVARAKAFQRLAAGGARGAAIQTITLLVGAIAILGISVTRVLSGQLGVGTFVLLQSYVFSLALPIGGLAAILRQSDLAFENLSEVITEAGAPDAAARSDHSPKALDLESGIRCQDVGFRYAQRPLLQALSFALPPRSFTVIVGANGSGKSTLARLLAGLLIPDTGRIEVFGADAGSLTAAERRRRILYVPQFVGLFDRSIRENGLYPPSQLSAAPLAATLEQWQFDPTGAPIDLEAPTGADGVRLSGGQIQKLELARLSAVSTPALILDETTSALDPRAQAAAILELRTRAPERMLILVTHARYLAEQADRVLFLEGGALAAFDTHRKLMRSHRAYRAFWRSEPVGAGPSNVVFGRPNLSEIGETDA